jgi:hypothetical protein
MEARKQRKWRRFAQGESFGSNPPPGHSYPLPRQTPTTSVDVSDPSTYGALPDEGLVDTLKSGTLIDLVGYGDQNLIKGGGPCGGPCKPREGDAFTRFFGQTTLVATNDKISDEFIKLHSNPSGTCFGDSGGLATRTPTGRTPNRR